jgi:hypothetical protein
MQMVGLSQLGWQEHVCTWPFAICGPETVVGRFRGKADMAGPAACSTRSQMTRSVILRPLITTLRMAHLPVCWTPHASFTCWRGRSTAGPFHQQTCVEPLLDHLAAGVELDAA